MTTPTIEEIVEEFVKEFVTKNGALGTGVPVKEFAENWLRTKLLTLQSHHEEEVKRVVERAVRWTMNNFEIAKEHDWGTKTFGEYMVEKAFEAITPITK